MSVPAIRVEGLSVGYSGTLALEDASLSLPPGTICGLVGMNGAGKTTLFRAIMGFLKLREGSVLVNGAAVSAAQRRSEIAYVPQADDIDWNFPVSVADVVMMGRYGHMSILRIPRRIDHEAVAEALARVEMSKLRDRQIGRLSGGQKKRAFLARALAQRGSILLLDEPFTGVDARTEEAVIDVLRELRGRGQTILISTHDLSSVSAFCDQVALINRTVIAVGRTEDVFTEENVSAAFGGMIRRFSAPARPVGGD